MTINITNEAEFTVIGYEGNDYLSELTGVEDPLGYTTADGIPVDVTNVEHAIAEGGGFIAKVREDEILTDNNGVAYYRVDEYTLIAPFVGTRPPRRPR
jgi:hypothetical protein